MSHPILTKLCVLTTFAVGTAMGGAVTWQLRNVARATPQTAVTINLPDWSNQSGSTPTLITAGQSRPYIDGLLGLRSDYTTRVDTLRALLVVLPDEGFPRLLSGLAAQDNDDTRRLLDVALRTWMDRDPAAAAQWAVRHNQQASVALRAWVKVDPSAAAEWIGKLTDPKQLEDLSKYTLPALFDQDQERALALVMAVPEDLRSGLFRTIIQKLSKTDPAGAIRRFGSELWDNGEGYHTLSPALSEWAKTDPRSAINWLVAQTYQNKAQLGHYLGNLANNGATNWQQIATIILETPDIAYRQSTITTMLSNRAREHPAEVIQFLDSTGDQNLRNRVLLSMASSYSDQEIDKTLPFALALPESSERNQKLNWLLSAWARHDPSAALDWMSKQNDPGVTFASPGVQTGILLNIAEQEPATAVAEWAKIEDLDTRKAALQPIAQAWGKTDPAAAVQWVFEQQQALSPDTKNPYLFSNNASLIFSWRKTDPEAALHWIEQASKTAGPADSSDPFAPKFDPFKALGGDGSETADRASTAQLLTKINDPETRINALSNHARDWLKFDRKSATAWLEKSNALSAEQAATLIAEAEKTGSGASFNPFL